MTRYLLLSAVVCLALPAFAVEVDHEEAMTTQLRRAAEPPAERTLASVEADPRARMKAARKEFRLNVKEMCLEPSSEACKDARKDYEEWKSDHL